VIDFSASGYIVGTGVGLAVLASVLAWGKLRERRGEKEAQQKQTEIDHENAIAIRKRTVDVKRVSDDDLRFRD